VAVEKSIAALRSLVAAWTPPARRRGNHMATGVEAMDDALGGGLPAGLLTEIVCLPGAGGQLVLTQLLATTRAARQRMALIDATDSFAPEAVPADALRHLVWARCQDLTQALAVADLFFRDGNFFVVVLDLRDVPAAALNRTPSTLWHRLHRAAERQPAAVTVFSRLGVVPAVRWRLALGRKDGTTVASRKTYAQRADEIQVQATRGIFGEMTA